MSIVKTVSGVSCSGSHGYADPENERVDEGSSTQSLLQLEEREKLGDSDDLPQGYDPYNSAT